MAILLPPQCWKARCMPPHSAKHSTWTPLTACDIPDLPMCHPPNSVLNATSAFGSCAAFHPEALDVMCAGCETFRTGVASTPRDVNPSQCNDYSHLHGPRSQAMRCWNQGSKSVLPTNSALLTSLHTHFHDRIRFCSLKSPGSSYPPGSPRQVLSTFLGPSVSREQMLSFFPTGSQAP